MDKDVLQGGDKHMQQTSGQKQKNIYKTRGGIKMFKEMKKRIKNEKGLTLIELLAVIVILAIVSAIAIPAIGNIIDNSKYNAVKADAINVINAANLYYTDNPKAATGVTVTELKTAKVLDTAGSIPEAATISKDTPRGLTATVTNAVGTKTVTFTGATVESINADIQKGSAASINAITATPATP